MSKIIPTYGPCTAVPTNVPLLGHGLRPCHSRWKWCIGGSADAPMSNLRRQSVQGHPWGGVDAIFAGGARVRDALEQLFVVSCDVLAALPIVDDGRSCVQSSRWCSVNARRPYCYRVQGVEAAGGPQ